METTPPHATQAHEATGDGSAPLPDWIEEIAPLDLLIALAAHKRTVIGTTLVVGFLAVCVCLLLPNTYTAEVVLMPPQNQSIGSALGAQLGSLSGVAALAGGGLLKNSNELYTSLFRSRTVEDAMINRFGLVDLYRAHTLSQARMQFERHALVDGTRKDGLIHITVTDTEPNRAARIANGYVEAYRDLSRHLALTEAGQRRFFFEQQMEQTKEDLAHAEEALKVTEQKTGVIQLDGQARALLESGAILRAQVAAKQVQVQAMRTYATGENAQLKQAEQELETLRGQLAALGGSATPPDGLLVPKGAVPEAGLEYMRKLRDVKYYEAIFEILARQYEMAKLDEARQGAVIQVVDPAAPPDRKSAPKRTLIVLGALAGGLVLGVVLALAQNAWARMNANGAISEKLALFRQNLLGRRAGSTQA